MNLTTQQQLVLEQQQRHYDIVDRTGEHLDNKAAAILQAGSLIIALSSVVSIPAIFTSAQPSPFALGGISIALVAFIGMVICAIKAWHPRNHVVPGNPDWNDAFDSYISLEADDAYNQVLSNLISASTTNRTTNERKAQLVTLAAWLLALQVAGILTLAVAGATLGPMY